MNARGWGGRLLGSLLLSWGLALGVKADRLQGSFLMRCFELSLSGNDPAVLREVAAHPAEARQELNYFLQPSASPPDEGGRHMATLLGRGLQLAGDGNALAQVKRRGLLDASLLALSAGPAAAVEAEEKLRTTQFELQCVPLWLEFYLDLGQPRRLYPMLKAVEATLDATGRWPGEAALRGLLLRGRLAAGDIPRGATMETTLKQLASLAPEPQDQLLGCLALMEEAHQADALDDWETASRRAQELVPSVPADQQAVSLLVVTSFEALRRSELGALSTAEVLSFHRQAWSGLTPADVPPGLTQFVSRARAFWAEQMRAAVLADPAAATRLVEAADLQVSRYAALVASQTARNRLGLEMSTWNAQNLLVEQLLRMGKVHEAEQALGQESDQEWSHREAWLQDREQLALRWLGSEVAGRMPAHPRPDARLGSFAWYRSRYSSLRLRVGLELGRPAVGDARAALHWKEGAEQGLGFLGEEDPRGYVLRFLLSAHPSGWQASADALADSLLADARKAHNLLGTIVALQLQGVNHESQGRVTQALSSYSQALETLERGFNELGPRWHSKEQLQPLLDILTGHLARIRLQQKDPAAAWEAVVRQQNFAALQPESEALESKPDVTRLAALRDANAVLQERVAAGQALGKTTAPELQLLASNKAEFHKLLADLRQHNPRYEAALAIRPANVAQLQKSLPAGTVALQYFNSSEALYIFVVTPENLRVYRSPVTAAELTVVVKRSRDLLLQATTDPELLAHPESFSWQISESSLYLRHTAPLREALQQLYAALIAPVEAELAGARTLAILPTGALHYVPYAALCRGKLGSEPEFLIQRFAVVSLVKASDLAQLGQPALADSPRLLALANPDGSLPGSEQEVADIQHCYPEGKVLVGTAATAQALQSVPPQTTYLHLATHGHLDVADATRSYLLMSGGQLAVGDIYGLTLEGTRLVTLSACRTALEGAQPGSELTSLADAFSVAGGRSVLASLWSISDAGTRAWMQSFYTRLATGESLAEAMRQAELSTSAQPALHHPFYWAAFTLFGDWR